MKLSKRYKAFQDTIYGEYNRNGRVFPWRETKNPYHIFLSEIMLQQTQAGKRTIEKYHQFLEKFPTIEALGKASFGEVLSVWHGLGYNRRAKALRDSARIIVEEYSGKVPDTIEQLLQLPGVGHYTASAVCTFAYNKPTVFIETNIRAVYTHFFFKKAHQPVIDREIMPLIKQTLDLGNPRRWYFALMDYGAMLKKKYPNINKKSKHYLKQSTFEGSDRQIRGLILKELIKGATSISALAQGLGLESSRIRIQILNLTQEGLVESNQAGTVTLST